MDTRQQVELLNTLQIASFQQHLNETLDSGLYAGEIEIFQMNVGYKCNLTCKHCHVNAGPDRHEMMDQETIAKCAELIKKHKFQTVDLTGGAPELLPELGAFISDISNSVERTIVRSNLTLLIMEKYRPLVETFVKHKVNIVSSLPDVTKDRTNKQRGELVFEKSIAALKLLNSLGYGKKDSDLLLDLVHNPVGAYLPAAQAVLEKQFKDRLLQEYNIEFNNLYVITNMPVSRFLTFLCERDLFEDYMLDLYNAFNPATVDNLMCRNTISVGWDGTLYDCDFNQMLGMPINGGTKNIHNFDLTKLSGRKILINNHCYGCTAGSGSSCQGETIA
jgi:radical SAM/Cys-rich protein